MSSKLSALAKDTAVYGASSIIGRFLNYLLVPLYTYQMSADSGGYGVITNIYAWTALILVILTCGMETGYFRFATKSENDRNTVYSTTLAIVGSFSLIFIGLVWAFLTPICGLLNYSAHPEFVLMMAVVVGMDAFQCIPFAQLRQEGRAWRFVSIKMLFIISNIVFNLFFYVACPYLAIHAPSAVDWFYDPNYGAGYAFVSNLISTSLQMVVFMPSLLRIKIRVSLSMAKQLFRYSLPLLVLGIAGILNQTVDKILFPFLYPDASLAASELAVYGGAVKIAMLLALLTQAFRYAYEPFVFNTAKRKSKADSSLNEDKETYSRAMTYFVAFGLLACLAVVCYLDILRYIIDTDYWSGLRVVPIVIFAELLMGVYFNLSFWYKLSDQTRWGAYISLIGCAVVITGNVLFVPTYGYMAAAWSGLAGYAVACVISYTVGQRKYPIAYDIRSIFKYFALCIALIVAAREMQIDNLFISLAYKTFLIVIYVIYLDRRTSVFTNLLKHLR